MTETTELKQRPASGFYGLLQKPAQPVQYEYIPVGRNRCYIYNNGRLLGRVDIENGQPVEYPEAGVMWLPVAGALAAMKGAGR